jgi:fumarylacetoacetase
VLERHPQELCAVIDETHDVRRRCWVATADGHPDFPIQNLPLGVYNQAGEAPRGGVRIGDAILDLRAMRAADLLAGTGAEAAAEPTLNAFLAGGAGPRVALRARLSELLSDEGTAAARQRIAPMLHAESACVMHVPCAIGDYTDFYAGIHHAMNVGRLLRPDAPLMPNYKYLPVAYHGRASSVRVSGGTVRRPNGQRKPASETVPSFGPSRNLDYELELGIWIGPGNALGEPVPVGAASSAIAGFCLLNDWSARDIQAWEYQPLGPFLAKNFHTTISSWIVTPEALAPFRAAQAARPEGDPPVMPHLWDAADQQAGALDLVLEVTLSTARMRAEGIAPHRLSAGNARHLYWTFAQMVAHQTSGGCDLRAGDLFGSGTISAPEPGGYGSLLEITQGGRQPVALPSGETRRFLEDGDEVTLTARAVREGFATVGLGACRGAIAAAA